MPFNSFQTIETANQFAELKMNLIDTPGFCDSNENKKDSEHFSLTCQDLKDEKVSTIMIACINLKIDGIVHKSMDFSISVFGGLCIEQMIVVVTRQKLD